MAYNMDRWRELLPDGWRPSWLPQMPFTDYHQLNLDWIIETVKEWTERLIAFFDEDGAKDLVEDVLEEHPEWVTTVMDGSITFEKLNNELKMVVSPIMFGAAGDGVTVDNAALNACFEFCANNGAICDGLRKTYIVDNSTASYCGHYGAKLPGGATVRNITLKLKSGSVDMETPLACLHNGKDYYFDNCTFIGELREPTIGSEDGGNHGIIFCDNNTMFPGDWIESGEIKFENCSFIDISSYGVFPTPFNNKLTIENCVLECEGPGVLTYATNSVILNSTYKNLPTTRNTIKTFTIDEIENFANPRTIKKYIYLYGLTSNTDIMTINHSPQTGVLYGVIDINKCYAGRQILSLVAPVSSKLDAETITIKNSFAEGVNQAGIFAIRILRAVVETITLDNVTCNTNSSIIYSTDAENIIIKNIITDKSLATNASNIINLYVESVTFKGVNLDGYISGRFDSVYANITNVYVKDIIIKTVNNIFWNNNIANFYSDGIICDTYTQLITNDTATTTTVNISGLIMPTANPNGTYIVNNTTAGGYITGISPHVAVNNAGTVTIDLAQNNTWNDVITNRDFTPTTPNQFEYTGISFTATKTTLVRVGASYAGSFPTGIGIATNSSSTVYMTSSAINSVESGFITIFPVDAGRTYYIWCKCNSTATPATRITVKALGDGISSNA